MTAAAMRRLPVRVWPGVGTGRADVWSGVRGLRAAWRAGSAGRLPPGPGGPYGSPM
ncbi:hypothetical protein FAIPA1_490008 [Frankia sp. AiPs1]